MTFEELQQAVMDYRGILREEDICPDCQGWGAKAYASTATWHGGIGGQMITTDVCNKCWGSGDRNRPWLSHKK